MRYIEEFRRGDLAQGLARAIAYEADPARDYHLMEFCGGHTHAIFRYGVQDQMPPNVHFVHGPGCPVCVLPVGRLDQAIWLAEQPGVILCSYADMLRVPAGGRDSLLQAKARGAEIRMIYSTQDALRIARANPGRQVVLFAIGFETTTPPTAVAIRQAAAEGLTNFSVFCNHVLTPAAIRAILGAPPNPSGDSLRLDGFLGPSHVSTIIGTRPYEELVAQYHKPVVIAGFEPLDVMQSVRMLIRQINEGRYAVENEYSRVVRQDGNLKAQALVNEVLELRSSFEWRGLGTIPNSALQIKDAYARYDAERRYPIPLSTQAEAKGCECPSILRGIKRPNECKLFGTGCTPDHPLGACMVSAEGACAAYWSYGRFRPSAPTRGDAPPG